MGLDDVGSAKAHSCGLNSTRTEANKEGSLSEVSLLLCYTRYISSTLYSIRDEKYVLSLELVKLQIATMAFAPICLRHSGRSLRRRQGKGLKYVVLSSSPSSTISTTFLSLPSSK